MKIVESYNTDESFLYDKTYIFIKGYATAFKLNYTLRALPLARKFHDGQYRKGEVIIDGKSYKLPYVLHVLKVCSTLLNICDGIVDKPESNFTRKDLDILLASALLHDSLEDCPKYFPTGDTDLMTIYGFPREVYNIVTLVSKRSGATEEELDEYFNKIKKNRLALLVKLADRSHNVEDLYVMSLEKLHKYVIETKEYIYPLTTYGKANYPEFSTPITNLKSKIRSLTENTEMLCNKFESTISDQAAEIAKLQKQIKDLTPKTSNRKSR